MNDAITSDVGDEGLCTSRCEVVNGLLQWCHEDVKVAGVHNVPGLSQICDSDGEGIVPL